MPVSVEKLGGYPKFGGGRDELSATQQFKIAWGDIDALYLELFPAGVGNKPSLPALFPGSSVLYADSFDAEPFVGDDDSPDCPSTNQEYDYARVTVGYKTIPYTQGGGADDQIITRRWTMSGDFLVLPSHALYWNNVGAGRPILDPDVRAGIRIPLIDLSVTLHRVTPDYFTSLQAAIYENVGCVNDALFEGAVAQTMLLLGANFDETVSAGGDITHQVEIMFQYRKVFDQAGNPQGWNHFYNPTIGFWERVVDKNNLTVYPTADFSTLYS